MMLDEQTRLMDRAKRTWCLRLQNARGGATACTVIEALLRGAGHDRPGDRLHQIEKDDSRGGAIVGLTLSCLLTAALGTRANCFERTEWGVLLIAYPRAAPLVSEASRLERLGDAGSPGAADPAPSGLASLMRKDTPFSISSVREVAPELAHILACPWPHKTFQLLVRAFRLAITVDKPSSKSALESLAALFRQARIEEETSLAKGIDGSEEFDDGGQPEGHPDPKAEGLQRAVVELFQTGELVSQIAYRLGYRHASQFNRDFRNLIGCSPSRYRQWISGGPRPETIR